MPAFEPTAATVERVAAFGLTHPADSNCQRIRSDLLDVVRRPYDGLDHVVMDDVHEKMLDPGKCDHPLAALGVVAQTPCDVAANLNLHSGLAEVDIAAVAQFKAHHVLHDP